MFLSLPVHLLFCFLPQYIFTLFHPLPVVCCLKWYTAGGECEILHNAAWCDVLHVVWWDYRAPTSYTSCLLCSTDTSAFSLSLPLCFLSCFSAEDAPSNLRSCSLSSLYWQLACFTRLYKEASVCLPNSAKVWCLPRESSVDIPRFAQVVLFWWQWTRAHVLLHFRNSMYSLSLFIDTIPYIITNIYVALVPCYSYKNIFLWEFFVLAWLRDARAPFVITGIRRFLVANDFFDPFSFYRFSPSFLLVLFVIYSELLLRPRYLGISPVQCSHRCRSPDRYLTLTERQSIQANIETECVNCTR